MNPNILRKYLDILDEQNAASVNVGNAKFNVDKDTNTLSGEYDFDDDTKLSATKDLSAGGQSTISATTKLAPNLTATATQQSPAYNKGQLAGTTSYSQTLTDPEGTQHTYTATKGVGFGGAGKDVKPGQNIATSYRKT